MRAAAQVTGQPSADLFTITHDGALFCWSYQQDSQPPSVQQQLPNGVHGSGAKRQHEMQNGLPAKRQRVTVQAGASAGAPLQSESLAKREADTAVLGLLCGSHLACAPSHVPATVRGAPQKSSMWSPLATSCHVNCKYNHSEPQCLLHMQGRQPLTGSRRRLTAQCLPQV